MFTKGVGGKDEMVKKKNANAAKDTVRDNDNKKQKHDGASASNAYVIKDPEAFARNMARMLEHAGHAAAAWTSPREQGGKKDQFTENFSDVARTLNKVSEYWLSDPNRALQAQTELFSRYMELWNASIRKMAGEDTGEITHTDPADKRFSAAEWNENQFFNFLKQTYLITSGWVENLVEKTEGLDEHTKHKAIFYTQQLINSLSPSNFPLTNPEVLRETFDSDGENLVRGMKMLAEDIASGKGDLKLRQVATNAFQVGRDVANTPGKIIHQNDVCQIIQYEAATENVLKRPLVIIPPWINKFYILDLNPAKSFVKWCVEAGHTVFVISWINPDNRQAGKEFESYAREGILEALDVAQSITGEKEFNMIGYCVGGTLLAATLALMARKGENRAASATFFATQVDFTYGGDLMVFVDEEQISRVEKSMATKGYLDGMQMANAFNMLRSRDLVWPYIVNNYLRGKEPLPFDLLYWNSDSTRMPAANHSFYLRSCYLENRLTRGEMVVAGEKLDLFDVKIPIYNLATRDDHIAPARSAYLGSQYFGGPVTFVLAGSGHIAGVINHPASGKYQYWTGGKPVGELENWIKTAEEHSGSWWPHWHDWIVGQNSEMVPARKTGSPDYKPQEDAPGSYVLVKS
jgi:polyhydroxyalkanoate synthase subunit PhaC